MNFRANSGGISLKFLLFVACIAALIPIAAVGWKDLYSGFLERSSPIIEIQEYPRGVGLTPVSIKIRLLDQHSGLDEVVVRTHQREVRKELLRKVLDGQHEANITVDFPGDRSSLDEGNALFEVKAFDRSFWSNSSEKVIPLGVDYRRPRIEVLTSQHNAIQGGSQFLFYRAFDESLAVSGVKVGNRTYLGYPARGIDESLTDPEIFVAIYAADIEQNSEDVSVRAFAEDQVGNATSVAFYNKIQRRAFRDATVKMSEDFLRERITALAEKSGLKLNSADGHAARIPPSSGKGGPEALIERFRFVNETLRPYNDNEIASLLRGPRFERYWEGPLQQQPGSIVGVFGDQVTYYFEGEPIGSHVRRGYEIGLSAERREVYAASGGIVIFSEDIGVYGRCVAIDHGLGLVSLYGYLDNVTVSRGEQVRAGQKIALAGGSGLSQGNRIYFEVRIHGVPVDVREWWDSRWFYSHITAKINEVKRTLGLPVYTPLR